MKKKGRGEKGVEKEERRREREETKGTGGRKEGMEFDLAWGPARDRAGSF